MDHNQLLTVAWYAIGFGYSLFAGLLIWKTHGELYAKYHDKWVGWRSKYTGLIERALYTAAMLAGHIEFIGVWLVLKSVAHWERFSGDLKQDKSNIDATAKFNGYFIDTGLSIAYGLAGGYVIEKFLASQFILAIAVMAALFCAHILLNRSIQSMVVKYEPIDMKDATHLTQEDK